MAADIHASSRLPGSPGLAQPKTSDERRASLIDRERISGKPEGFQGGARRMTPASQLLYRLDSYELA